MNAPDLLSRSVGQLNDDLNSHFSRNRTNDYDRIACLAIYWKNGGAGYRKEALDVQNFFTSRLGYPTDIYEIPLEDSYWELDREINRFMASVRRKHSLAIIHYGGHGAEDSNRDKDLRVPLRSVWAAGEDKDSPSLNWSDMQPKLGNSEGHVLLILDCCFAAQAARGADRVIPPNVELVAACAMRVKVPAPSNISFTSKFLKEAGEKLARDGYIRISEMHDTLPVRDRSMLQTPQHWGLQGLQSTIRLDPLPATDFQLQSSRQQFDSLSLRIMTRDPFDDDLLDDILEWLKTHAPRRISSVNITEITSLAGSLRGFVLESKGSSASVAGVHSMTQESQKDIRGGWNRFKMNLASAAKSITAGLAMYWGSEGTIDEVMVDDFLEDFKKNVQALQRVIQRGVLTLPQLVDKEFLVSAIQDANLKPLDITDILQAQLMARFPSSIPHSMETTPVSAHSQSGYDLAVPLSIAHHEVFGNILVEYKFYESEEEVSIKTCERKIKRLAAVLQNSEPRTFHTPKCLGWFHEKSEARFALIFQRPHEDFDILISLRQILEAGNLISNTASAMNVVAPTLGERFTIARQVCKALARWHSAGWLHQGIASHNIVFLRDQDGTIRYSEPYLCGFEFSRMYNDFSRDKHLYKADMDIYKHPDRQGRPPKVRHSADHDYYSLGLLLVEIGMWDCIPNMLKGHIRKKGSSGIQVKLKKHAKDYLPHLMGKPYEQATLTCLEAGLASEMEGTGTMQKVVERFEKLVLMALEANPTVEARRKML
jgi:hypothetical protein